jgi:hypothetical protein
MFNMFQRENRPDIARIIKKGKWFILKRQGVELYRHYEYVEVIRFAANAGYRVEI